MYKFLELNIHRIYLTIELQILYEEKIRMTEDELIKRGVREAQRIAPDEGLEVGQVVAHPDDELIYALKDVKGDTAIVWLSKDMSPTGEEIIKEFPLCELFDPNVALNIAVKTNLEENFPSIFQADKIN